MTRPRLRQIGSAPLLSVAFLGCSSVPTPLDGGVSHDGGSPPTDAGEPDVPRPGPDGGRVDAASDGGEPSRAIGTVKNVSYASACDPAFGPAAGSREPDGGDNPNFRCVTMTVSCPGIEDLQATVGLSAQAGGSTKGVIVTHDGSTGTRFFEGALPETWFADGFDVASVAWRSPWQCPRGSPSSDPTTCIVDATPLASRPGLLEAACRPATVFAWIHDRAELPGGAPLRPSGAAYCGFGFSAGSGALWYSLLHYGMGAQFDFVGATASTPYARIDIGCDPASAGKRVATPCSNLPTDPLVPEQFDSNHSTHAGWIDDWTSTTSCDLSPSPAELAYWRRTSIVSNGARYDIPTLARTYDCINAADVDVIPGMNAYLFASLRKFDPASARFTSLCTLSGTNGTCTGEVPGDGGLLENQALSDMETLCIPLKR